MNSKLRMEIDGRIGEAKGKFLNGDWRSSEIAEDNPKLQSRPRKGLGEVTVNAY